MELYKDKSPEELLSICKGKFTNGRTYDELAYFLNRHNVDKEKQKYIFGELEKYEQELKKNPPKKKKLPFAPINMVIGVVLIVLAITVLIIGNMQGWFYTMALIIACGGFALIGIEMVKVFINNFFRN